MPRDNLFEQYMRGEQLGISGDFDLPPSHNSNPAPPPPPPPPPPHPAASASSRSGSLSAPPPAYDPTAGGAVFSRPPLYPSHSGNTPDRPSRAPSSTPSQRTASQTPAGEGGGGGGVAAPPSHSANPADSMMREEVMQLRASLAAESSALEKKNQMLVEQEEELVQQEAVIQALRKENLSLKSAQQQQSGSVSQEEYDSLKRGFDEAGMLTEQAGALLQKVQGDLDTAQREAEGLLERLIPGELQRVSFDTVPRLVNHVGRRVEELLQGTLDAAAKLEEEAEALRAASAPDAQKMCALLEAELDAAGRRNAELTDSITALQGELAQQRAAGVQAPAQMESDLRRAEQARAESERQRLSQSQLLKTTEQAYKRAEDELKVVRRQLASQGSSSLAASLDRVSSTPDAMQGDLYKLGTVTHNAPAQWKKRHFAADHQCLQYFEKQEDASNSALAKGVRYYASQQTFVSRFVPDASHLSDGSQRVMGVTSMHPKATDPNSFYFGFIPKHDNALSTQAFLLRTQSRDNWLAWCKFLSKMAYGGTASHPQTPAQKSESASFASPEVIGGVTPPYARGAPSEGGEDEALRGTLSAELKKTEDTLRAMVQDQAPLRKRADDAEAELNRIRAELDEARHTVDLKAKTVDVYQREAVKHEETLTEVRLQNRSLSEAVQAAAAEAASLRDEVVRLREKHLEAVKDAQGRTSAQPITCSSGTYAPQSDVQAAEAQTDFSINSTSPQDQEAKEKTLRDLQSRLRRATDENRDHTAKLKEQEAEHDAQIAAFCEQVLKDMDAIKLQSKMEIARRDEDWQKEVDIWQQLVAEKEQQIAMSAHKSRFQQGVMEIADAPAGHHTASAESQWKVIGTGSTGHQPSTVLSLKLSTSGGLTVETVDAPRTYGTRIAVDKRKLSQVSVTDNPASRDSMSRTWKFKSLSSDGSAISLSLSIVPSGAEASASSAKTISQPQQSARPRRGSASSSLSHARSFSARSRAEQASPHRTRTSSRRNSQVFVP